MSIWKSPVFYFGIALVLVVVAALAAPYVVPWNSYRADLESYGKKLTGRDVSIGGNIAVILFPWPQLEARQVAVGNPAGFSDDAFVKADVVRVSLSLGGLFSGTVNVESVDVAKPQVNLQRNAAGDVNWIFAPKEQVTGEGLLSRVKLDQIQLSDGLISFDDLRSGRSTVFSDLNARLSAQSVLGPWRIQGEAKWNDRPFELSITTNAKEAAQPLKLTVRLSPEDISFPMASVEGTWDGTQFKGTARLDPQASTGEKSSAEGAFKPLTFQAAVEASTERLSLLKIRIGPTDRKDSGTLIEGDAVVEFGTQAHARINLQSPRVNLDTLVGPSAMQQWRDGGFLNLTNQLLAILPPTLVTDFAANFTLITTGGQALNDVRLTGTMQKEAIRIQEFAAQLPGRSLGVFDGVVFPAKDTSQLSGKFKFESGDTRALLGWLAPDWKAAIDKHWTGSRGRLEIQSGKLDWSAERLAVSDVIYALDGSPGKAAVSSSFGAAPILDVAVDAGQLDIDSLIPNGWSILRDGGFPYVLTVAAQNLDSGTVERRINFKAESLVLNGATARQAALNLVSNANGLDIRQLDIGSVNGAHLHGEGVILDKDEGPQGSLDFQLEAQDPRGFLQLVGLKAGAGHWMQALGATQFKAKLKATPEKNGPELVLDLRGSSGALNVAAVVNARDLQKGRNATLDVSGGLNSTDSAAFAKLVDLVPVGTTGPGDVTFSFNGSLDQGFVGSTTFKALDVVTDFSGTVDVNQPYFGLTGKLSAKSPDGQPFMSALGVPLAVVPLQPLDMAAVISVRDGALSLLDVTGHVAGRRFSGIAGATANGRLQADIETDSLDAREAMVLAFMPWQGPVTDTAQGFAALDELNISGDIFVKPLQFETLTGNLLKEVVVGFGFEKDKRQLTMTAAGEQGLKFDAALTPRGSSYDLAGTLRWPFALSQLLAAKDGVELVKGDLIAEGDFRSTGSSPAAALAAAEGKGHFWLSGAVLSRLTMDGYASAVMAAKTPDALSQAFAKLDSVPGSTIGQRIGNYSVTNGAVEFSAIPTTAVGVSGTILPQLDLTSGQIKIAAALSLTGQPDLPPVNIIYAGTAGHIEVRNGTSALAAKLGYDLLSKEMANLEQLQQEQQALAAKEDAQRRDDELRFADYQATKAELREQTRVRRFQAGEREKRAASMQAIVDAAIKTGAATSRIELLRHARRLDIQRGMLAVPRQP